MSDSTVTLRELAASLAKAARRDEKTLYDQLRGWVQRGLLSPSGGGGRGAALEFGVHDVYRARILLALKDIGLTEPAIRSVDHSMRTETVRSVREKYSFAEAIAASRRGDSSWMLRVVFQDSEHVHGYFEPPARMNFAVKETFAEKTLSASRDPTFKWGILFLIPAGQLIAPIVRALEGNS